MQKMVHPTCTDTVLTVCIYVCVCQVRLLQKFNEKVYHHFLKSQYNAKG